MKGEITMLQRLAISYSTSMTVSFSASTATRSPGAKIARYISSVSCV